MALRYNLDSIIVLVALIHHQKKPRQSMDGKLVNALRKEWTIDITTTGRLSGKLRRIEIWFHNVDDVIYISGSPGKRDWYANLCANPEFIFHLKGSVQADLQAEAIPVTDFDQRRTIMVRFDGSRDLKAWVARSPLVRGNIVEQ